MLLIKGRIKQFFLTLLLVTAGFSVSAQDGIIKESPLQIGIGSGVFNYQGEINNSGASSPYVGQLGITFDASRKLYSFLDVGFTYMNGTITGNQRTGNHLNFQTSLNAISVYGFYNWEHLVRGKILHPYTSIGLETFEFNSKGDMVDALGKPYYYWSEGSVKSLPQSSPNAVNAVVLSRDYFYETDLRKANLDGLGEYSQVSFAIPIGAGVVFNISERFHLRMGTSFHYTFTDLIDNVSTAGTGARQGKPGNDYYFFNSLSLHYDWFTSAPAGKKGFDFVDYFALDMRDRDNDGIIDFYDRCLGTPAGVAVDSNGCAIDTDLDGIGDYKDKQASRDSAYVDSNGVEMTDADYMNWYRRFIDSVDIPVDVRNKMNLANKKKGVVYRVLVHDQYKIPEEHIEKFLAQPDLISALNKDNQTLYLVGQFGELEEAKARQKQLLEQKFPMAKIMVQKGSDFITLEEYEKEGGEDAEKLKNVEGQYAVQLGNTAADANLEEKSKFYKGKEEVKTIKGDKNSTDYVVGSFTDHVEAIQALGDVDKKLFPNAKVVKVKDGKIVTDKDSTFFEKPKPKTVNPLEELEGKYVVKAGKITDKTTAEEKKKLESLPDSKIIENADGTKDVLVGKYEDQNTGKQGEKDLKTKGLAKAELMKVEGGQLKKPAPELKEGEYAVKVGTINKNTSAEEKKKLEAIPNSKIIENADGTKDVVLGTYKSMENATKTLTDSKKNGFTSSELMKVENGKLKSASGKEEGKDMPKDTPKDTIEEPKNDLAGKYTVKVGEFDKGASGEEMNKLLSISDVQSTAMSNPERTLMTAGKYDTQEEAKKRATQLNEQGFATEIVKFDKDGKNVQNIPGTKSAAKQTEVSTQAVVYRVQLGAFRNKVSPNAFRGVKVISFEGKDKLFRYATGSFESYKQAQEHKTKMREQGFSDAFVAAYKDGDRVPITDLVKPDEFIRVESSPEKTTPEKIVPKTEVEKEIVEKKVHEQKAPAKDSAVIYKVQVAAVAVASGQSEEAKKIPELQIEVANDYRRYLSGSFTNFNDAVKRKEEMVKAGYPGAYVVSYQNGKRVSVTPTVDENTIRPSEIENTKSSQDTGKVDVSTLKIHVQVGLFAGEVPADVKAIFATIPDLKTETTPQGLKRYTAGEFKNPAEAAAYKESLKAKGLKDAFLIAFYNGIKINLATAMNYYERRR
ncbi:MAG: hypothetical protein ACKOXB_12095 [Flavobacteriales bacterium]